MPIVIRNPIEHCIAILPHAWGTQPGQIDPLKHRTRCRRNSGNPVGLPYIGIYFSVNIFQFVEIQDRLATICDSNLPYFLECRRIQQVKDRSTIAQNQVLTVMRQPPAFPWVAKGPDEPEAETIVDEANMRLPRQLNQIAAPVREAFTEVFCL